MKKAWKDIDGTGLAIGAGSGGISDEEDWLSVLNEVREEYRETLAELANH